MPINNLTDVINLFTTIGLRVIPFLGVVAFFAFVVGIVKFIKAAGEGEIKESKNFIIWGIVGLTVLVSVWGLISFLRGEAGFTDAFGIPQIKF